MPRHPNVHLQRHREQRGETQQEFAEAIRVHALQEFDLNLGTSHKLVANWERGRSRPDPTYRRVLRSLLQTDNAGLGLIPSATTTGRMREITGEPLAVQPTPRAYTGSPQQGDQQEVEEVMRREVFLRGGGAFIAGLLVPPSPYPSEAAAHALTEEWLAEAARYSQALLLAAHRDGAMAHFGAVAAHAYNLTHLFQQTPPWHALRPRLASSAAVACYQTGQGVWHQLHYLKSEDWFLQAAKFATLGHDEDLHAAAVCTSAAMLVKQHRPQAALERVMQLPAANPHRQPTLAGWHVAIELAVTRTALGDGDQALSALDRIDELAAALDNEPPSALHTRPREGTSEHWRGHCLTKLGLTAQARQSLERDARTVPSHITVARAAGAQVINLADVEAQDGAVDAAAHLLRQVWPVARETGSLKAQAQIREVRAKLPPAGASRAVQELDEVLASV